MAPTAHQGRAAVRSTHTDDRSASCHDGLRPPRPRSGRRFGSGAPARLLLGVVAPFAGALTVVRPRRAARRVVDDVVEVADRCVAPGRPARAVPRDEEPAQTAVEPPPRRVHRHQRPVVRVRVEPPEPHRLGRLADEVAGPPGGNRAVAGDLRRCRVVGEQRTVRDDDLHLDRHRGRCGLAGHPLDEQVGHELARRTRVPAGPARRGRRRERRVHRDPLGHRQVGGDVAHRVGGRPDRDPPLLLGAPAAVQGRLGVQPVGDRSHPPDQLAVTEAPDALGAETLEQLGVHR